MRTIAARQGGGNSPATVGEIIEIFDAINDRAELVAFLTPFRMPHCISDFDKARLINALIVAASRCWKGRSPA